MQVFKKCAVFTDLHLGAKGNSVVHNRDCEEFVDWFIEEATKNGAETGIFMGDWHHNRNNLNINTLSVSVKCLEKLGNAFETFYFIPGNHDQFYRNNRDVNSVEWGRNIKGITIIDDITTIGDVTFSPWLIGDEWKSLVGINSRYIFGHFELPDFYMNAMIKMPNHGGLSASDFTNSSYVFSGHYHMRQISDPVVYIGNAFPHNYSDAWDDNRGMMILQYGCAPEFLNWENAPRYRTCKLSELIDKPENIVGVKTYIKASLDTDISFEEAAFIKDELMNTYDIRELSLIPPSHDDIISESASETKFTTVDEVVFQQIDEIDSDVYDKTLLASIYNSI